MDKRVIGTSLLRNNMLCITIALWLCLLPLRSVANQSCSSTSCFDCLNSNCAWFPIIDDSSASGECFEDCSVIPDAPCYNFEFYPNRFTETICATAEADVPDWTMCSLALDCTGCVSLLQSDGVSPCAWYSEGNFCGSGICTDYGCGLTTCGTNTTDSTGSTPVPAPSTIVAAAPTSLCNLNATSCEECLLATDYDTEVPYNCAWSTNRCIDSCSEVPGYPCYSAAAYPNLIGNPIEICSLEESATRDDDICTTASTCTKCIDLLQSDNSTRCLWFEHDDLDVTPYCGAHNSSSSVTQVNMDGCDLNGICGVSDCSLINMINPPTSVPVEGDTKTSATSPKSGTERIVVWSQILLAVIVLLCFTLTNVP